MKWSPIEVEMLCGPLYAGYMSEQQACVIDNQGFSSDDFQVRCSVVVI